MAWRTTAQACTRHEAFVQRGGPRRRGRGGGGEAGGGAEGGGRSRGCGGEEHGHFGAVSLFAVTAVGGAMAAILVVPSTAVLGFLPSGIGLFDVWLLLAVEGLLLVEVCDSQDTGVVA